MVVVNDQATNLEVAAAATMTWQWLCRISRQERVLETLVSLGSRTVHPFRMVRVRRVGPVVLLLEKLKEIYNIDTNLSNFDVGVVMLLQTPSCRAMVNVARMA